MARQHPATRYGEKQPRRPNHLDECGQEDGKSSLTWWESTAKRCCENDRQRRVKDARFVQKEMLTVTDPGETCTVTCFGPWPARVHPQCRGG